MTINRQAAKRDENEPAIVTALEALGCSVDRVPGGNGRQDLLVGDDGDDTKMEVKMPGKTLNPAQKKYHREWKGMPIHVVFTPAEAVYIIEQKRLRRKHGR